MAKKEKVNRLARLTFLIY